MLTGATTPEDQEVADITYASGESAPTGDSYMDYSGDTFSQNTDHDTDIQCKYYVC